MTSLGLINGDVSMSLTELGKQTCEELFGKIESMQPVVETVEEVKEVSETSQLASMFTPQELYLMIDNLSKVSVFDNASIEASALAHNLRAKFNSTVKLLLETNTREELGFKCICHNLEFSDCPKLEVRKVA